MTEKIEKYNRISTNISQFYSVACMSGLFPVLESPLQYFDSSIFSRSLGSP